MLPDVSYPPLCVACGALPTDLTHENAVARFRDYPARGFECPESGFEAQKEYIDDLRTPPYPAVQGEGPVLVLRKLQGGDFADVEWVCKGAHVVAVTGFTVAVSVEAEGSEQTEAQGPNPPDWKASAAALGLVPGQFAGLLYRDHSLFVSYPPLWQLAYATQFAEVYLLRNGDALTGVVRTFSPEGGREAGPWHKSAMDGAWRNEAKVSLLPAGAVIERLALEERDRGPPWSDDHSESTERERTFWRGVHGAEQEKPIEAFAAYRALFGAAWADQAQANERERSLEQAARASQLAEQRARRDEALATFASPGGSLADRFRAAWTLDTAGLEDQQMANLDAGLTLLRDELVREIDAALRDGRWATGAYLSQALRLVGGGNTPFGITPLDAATTAKLNDTLMKFGAYLESQLPVFTGPEALLSPIADVNSEHGALLRPYLGEVDQAEWLAHAKARGQLSTLAVTSLKDDLLLSNPDEQRWVETTYRSVEGSPNADWRAWDARMEKLAPDVDWKQRELAGWLAMGTAGGGTESRTFQERKWVGTGKEAYLETVVVTETTTTSGRDFLATEKAEKRAACEAAVEAYNAELARQPERTQMQVVERPTRYVVGAAALGAGVTVGARVRGRQLRARGVRASAAR